MSTLAELESEARSSRMRFTATWNATLDRLTLLALADEALGLAVPKLAQLRTARGTIRRHPLIASAALAGIAFLLRRALASGEVKPDRAKRVRNPQA